MEIQLQPTAMLYSKTGIKEMIKNEGTVFCEKEQDTYYSNCNAIVQCYQEDFHEEVMLSFLFCFGYSVKEIENVIPMDI
jgi:hypothetical protein